MEDDVGIVFLLVEFHDLKWLLYKFMAYLMRLVLLMQLILGISTGAGRRVE